MTTIGNRTSDHEIEPLLLERWSPRAFTGEAIPEGELMQIFEAARWAPSSYNSQPWRFVYARPHTPHPGRFVPPRRDPPHCEHLLGLLNEFNRSWANNAAVVIIVASNSVM